MSRLFNEQGTDSAAAIDSAPDSEPVSPIGSDEDGMGDGEIAGGAQRLSYLSATSAAGVNRDCDELVSPVGPEEVERDNEEGTESQETVSPLDSRRTSSES